MRIFISGPMTGYPKYNFPKFDAVAELLMKAGIEAVNPATISRKYKEEDILKHGDVFQDMMGEQLKVLRVCTHILLLDGWQKSVGAKRELKYALIEGLDVLAESDLEEWLKKKNSHETTAD